MSASTADEEMLAPSKPPVTSRKGVIAAADISIAASFACTIAARRTVRIAARALPSACSDRRPGRLLVA
jgi:hypothetical protein